MNLSIAADRSGELSDFQAAARQSSLQNSAGLIQQVAEALGSEHGVNVARDRCFDFVQIVIGQRVRDHQLDRRGGRAGIVLNSWRHGCGEGLGFLIYFGYGGPGKIAKARYSCSARTTRANSCGMVRVESEILCRAAARSCGGNPSASPHKNTNSRTARSRRSPIQ